VAVAMCLPMTGSPSGDRHPKKHGSLPPPGKGHRQRRRLLFFQDSSPGATGYYAETGTRRDSGTPFLPAKVSHPPSASLKRERSGRSSSTPVEDQRKNGKEGLFKDTMNEVDVERRRGVGGEKSTFYSIMNKSLFNLQQALLHLGI
jgi:hypothetical protein